MKRFWLSPRWLFYGWVGLVYLWGLINYAGSSVGEVCHRWESLGEACYTTFLPGMSTKPLSLQFWAGPDLAAFLIFTLSMALVALLDWVILTSKVEGSFSWLAYLLLGGLVLIAKLAIQGDVSAFGDEIALALYLTLLLQAYSQLKNLRLWFIVGAGYFILFQFGSNLDGGWQYVWQTRFPYISWGVLFSLLVIIVAFYLEQLHSHRRLALTHHQLKTTYEQLTDSARQIKALTLLTERQRLARELHDTLSQQLVGLIRQLDVIEAHLKLQHTERALTLVQDAAQMARTALSEAREAIDDLRMVTVRTECLEAVSQELERFRALTGIACESELGALLALPEALSNPARWVVREALTNIARHAQARQVWVRGRESPDWVELEIRDDGIGFEPKLVAEQKGHYGLVGLHEQARLVGGAVEFTSGAGQGTVIRFSFPKQKQQQVGWNESNLKEYSSGHSR